MTERQLSGTWAAARPSRPRLVVNRGERPRSTRPEHPPAQPVSNARVAVVMLLVAETMFFAGLIGAYLLFRLASPQWPPPNLPRLPLAVTWVNTIVLMLSAATMLAALRASRSGDGRTLGRGMAVTALLGTAFLVVQGSEWAGLIHHGLTLSSGTYGASFYVLIGAHGVHVGAAVLWLGVLCLGIWRGGWKSERYAAIEVCSVYWFFVCALWLVLFALVYP